MNTQSKQTILLCTIGSAGDVNPFIGIGQNLIQLGFRVVLITSQYFESQASSAGLEFFGLGSSEDYQSIVACLTASVCNTPIVQPDRRPGAG